MQLLNNAIVFTFLTLFSTMIYIFAVAHTSFSNNKKKEELVKEAMLIKLELNHKFIKYVQLYLSFLCCVYFVPLSAPLLFTFKIQSAFLNIRYFIFFFNSL